MNKILVLARVTYWQRVRSGAFLVLTLGLPLIMVISGAVPFFLQQQNEQQLVLGYVDNTGRLDHVERIEVENISLTLIAYANQTVAQEGLAGEVIGGYLVIPEDYFQGQAPLFYAPERPDNSLETALAMFMRRAMLPGAPAWLLERLEDPSHVTYVDHHSGQEIDEGIGLIIRIALPFVLALMFALTLLTGANQMGSAIIREKDQRSMEMIITSISPIQLVAGKVLGLTWLSLTQVTLWTSGGVIALGLLLFNRTTLHSLGIPWHAVVWAILLGVPGYFLYAILAAGLGLVAGDSRQAQQLAGLLGLVGLAPLWLAGLLVRTPHAPFAVALTLFPLTGPIVSLMRMAFSQVPFWQLTASLALLIASLAASIWLVARIFRAAMLMYGQTLRPRQLWQALREA
jgi:ABC-2 type transport system permease protein